MKKIFKNILKHKKAILTLSLIAIVSIAIYTDVFNLGKNTPVTDYLYNSDYTDGKTKILGEATLVDSTKTINDSEYDRYFEAASINREKSRDEALQTLQVVVDSAEELPETRNLALTQIMQIASDIEIESAVEEMIKAKGFEDCVAIISGDNINVIVKSDGLLTSEVAQITDIVKGETGFSAENIRIVEKI